MFNFHAILYVRTRTRMWLKQWVGLCTHQQYCNWTVHDLHALRHMDHHSHYCKFTKHYRHFLKWLIKTFSKWRHDVSWILGVCFNAQCLLSVLWAVGWSSVGHFAVLCHLDDCNHVPGVVVIAVKLALTSWVKNRGFQSAGMLIFSGHYPISFTRKEIQHLDSMLYY